MVGATPEPVRACAARCVLLVIDDATLAELLAEALVEAGHAAQSASSAEVLAGELACETFHAGIVDLDTWERQGSAVVARLRSEAPGMTVIALLPCGGLASDFAGVPYHLAVEKPARLQVLLAAVGASASRSAEP